MNKIILKDLKPHKVYQLSLYGYQITGTILSLNTDTMTIDKKYNVKNEAEIVSLNTSGLDKEEIYFIEEAPFIKDYTSIEQKNMTGWHFDEPVEQEPAVELDRYEKYDCEYLKPGHVYSLLINNEWIKAEVTDVCIDKCDNLVYVFLEHEYNNPNVISPNDVLLSRIKDWRLEPEIPVTKNPDLEDLSNLKIKVPPNL